MKKLFISIILILSLLLSGSTVFAEEEGEILNIVPAIDSGFEGVSSVEDTSWFKLIDPFGDSRSKTYSGLEIKTGGAHTGENYLSMAGDKSWYSPSINLYPILNEAGAGSYVITYYIRSTGKLPGSFMVRALAADLDPDNEDSFPNIEDRGSSNYYRSFSGTLTADTEWSYFESDPIEVTEGALAKQHNWWFCLGSLENSQYTVDIDDFCIVPADDYVSPSDIPETEISYLTADAETEAFKPEDIPADEQPSAVAATASPTPTDGPTVIPAEEKDITLVLCVGAFIITCAVAATVTVLIKKRKK